MEREEEAMRVRKKGNEGGGGHEEEQRIAILTQRSSPLRRELDGGHMKKELCPRSSSSLLLCPSRTREKRKRTMTRDRRTGSTPHGSTNRDLGEDRKGLSNRVKLDKR